MTDSASTVAAVRRRLASVTRWPLWSLPGSLRAYLLVVVGGWLVAVTLTLPELDLVTGDLVLAGVLFCCAAASIEATHRFGQAADRVWRDMLGIWTIPVLLLLPPQYALLAPIPLQLLSQLRVRRSLPHRVAFSIAAVGLASDLASWLFHATIATVGPAAGTIDTAAAAELGVWLLLGAGAGVVRHAVNLALIATAVKASDHEARWRNLLFSRDGLALEGVQISAGLAVGVLCLVQPWLAPPLLLPAMLFMLGRNAMSMQLRALAHTDSKTGLLSAGAWEREANVVIARAHRSQTPLAVLMLDMDDFKRINDTLGHLGGDAVLRLIATELRAQLRPTDLVGRFGGDEFAILLPGTPAAAAYQTAERLREHIAHTVIADSDDGIRVTVSVGMVTTFARPRTDATELLAAADHALYRSKRAGRNRTSRLTIAPDPTSAD